MSNEKEQDRPLVSVIIPTYNRVNWLGGAIDSVLEQTCRNFEILIVDDGSTDETSTLVARYGERVNYYYQANRGVSAARNFGIQHARADLVAFLDSDDRWLKNKLQTQVDLMVSDYNVKICYADEIWIRRGVRVNPKKVHQKYSGWIYQKCLPLCIISPSSVMMKREVFDEVGLFDENLPVCEDYDLWLRMSCRCPIHFIDEPLVIKNGGHEDQLSQKLWGMDRFRVRALVKILEEKLLSSEDRRATVEMLHKKCTILAQGCYKRGKTEEGDHYFDIIKRYVE